MDLSNAGSMWRVYGGGYAVAAHAGGTHLRGSALQCVVRWCGKPGPMFCRLAMHTF